MHRITAPRHGSHLLPSYEAPGKQGRVALAVDITVLVGKMIQTWELGLYAVMQIQPQPLAPRNAIVLAWAGECLAGSIHDVNTLKNLRLYAYTVQCWPSMVPTYHSFGMSQGI
jgi:hypothetical protein